MTCQSLNWPATPNRWLYPTVYGWDRDEEGWLVIPALIAFFPNPFKPLTLEERGRFQKIVQTIADGRWDFVYDGPDLIWAQRLPRTVREEIGEREVQYHYLPTHEPLPKERLRDRVRLRDRAETSEPSTAAATGLLAMSRLWKGVRKSVRL